MEDDPIRIFISYSHDSEEHKRRLRDLADRMRAEGLDCEIDQYIHQSPAEGWPKWMMRQVAGARFVVVACTESYFHRVTVADEPGVGLGSRWEGALITQELYEGGGANTKFIPIVFDPADAQFRPPFLRGATFYDMASPDGYDRLYRHITNQPTVIKPPLGKIRRMEDPPPGTVLTAPTELPSAQPHPAGRNLQALVLLFPLEVDMQPVTFEAVRIEAGERVTVEVVAGDPATTAMFTKLSQNTRGKLGLSFRHSPLLVTLLDARQVVQGGEERWVLTFVQSREHLQQSASSEMSFSNYSADNIAELRARRILLNERRADDATGNVGFMNDSMLEVLIRGLNTLVEARKSPFPEIYRLIGAQPRYFLAVAKLFAQLLLYLSTTVDRIIRLDLDLVSTERLAVNFEGQRPRRYMNVDPPVIRVVGECDLTYEPETEA